MKVGEFLISHEIKAEKDSSIAGAPPAAGVILLEKHRLYCTKGQLITNQNEEPGDYSFR
jgi:hypothetical protein